MLHQVDFRGQLGILGSVGIEQLRPFPPQARAAGSHSGCEMFIHAIRNVKLFILGPAVETLCESYFFFA